MTFATSRDAYDAFMGRYANGLAPRLIAFAGIQQAERGPFTLSATARAVKGRA